MVLVQQEADNYVCKNSAWEGGTVKIPKKQKTYKEIRNMTRKTFRKFLIDNNQKSGRSGVEEKSPEEELTEESYVLSEFGLILEFKDKNSL